MCLTLPAVNPDHASAAAQAFYVLLSTVILKKSRKVLPPGTKKERSLAPFLFNIKCQSMFCRKAFVRSSFGCAKNASGSPCSTIVPSAMKMTWLAASRANAISCVTTTIVMRSSASSRIVLRTSPVSSGSSRREDARERRALLLATRELRRIVVRAVREADLL